MASTEQAVSADAEAQKRKAIMAIMLDKTLTEAEKSRKRQELMMGSWAKAEAKSQDKETAGATTTAAAVPEGERVVSNLDENLKCAICMDLCDRPVTAPCQHNFCLACFNKWTNQGKKTCPTCRAGFPSKFAQNPRINTALTVAIRLAKNPVKAAAGSAKEPKRVDDSNRPDEAFVTDRAVRSGRANACSGRIMVTTPNDYFGPIGPEYDPERKRGVLVGDHWLDRLDCRQWGAHYPHVAGIAGQSEVGAQSVVLSGGYLDDKDEGEWFLYTGSGGRDLSGNKRTNKDQSFDQEFTKMNKALMLSCTLGLPVRVVRSHKEKRSNYAPTEEQPVRYDGVYRILKCWRKPGMQNFLVCRYLFVRCDNGPAPWSTEEGGDQVRMEVPEEAQEEIRQAKGEIYEMGKEPYWDYQADKETWGWTQPSPTTDAGPGAARKSADPSKKVKARLNEHEKALKEFKCGACKNILVQPIRTPCGHNFCKGCLDKKFAGQDDILAPNAARSLRIRKAIKPCPSCSTDICEFLSNAQVNREMSEIITKLQASIAEARKEAEQLAAAAPIASTDEEAEVAEEGEEEEGEEEGAAEEEKEDDPVPSGNNGSKKVQKKSAVTAPVMYDKEGEQEVKEGEKGTSKAVSGVGAKRGRGKKAASGSAEETEEGADKKAPTKRQRTSKAAKAAVAKAGEEKGEEKEAQVTFMEVESGDGKAEDQTSGEEVTVPPAAADAKGEAGPSKQPEESAPVAPATQAYKYTLELRTLMSEFPEADEELVKCFLDDQDGDLKEVRFQVRKITAPAPKVKRTKAKAATEPAAN